MGEVVTLQNLGNGIAKITMADKASKNTFSKELIEGLKQAFSKIDADATFKVVILTGYENYFCCGGTKDELLSINRGNLVFTELDFFLLPLECKIPVIAAMQGHAIGGGLVFGLYSDFIILGKENIYTTNFMKFGFTPGMGATYIIPLKFGNNIGSEMLFTAENYRGIELKERGVEHRVVPKSEVFDEALKLAESLSEKPRISLITLKKHLNLSINSQLPQILKQELAMHAITFHTPEVAKNIELLFR